MAMRDSCLRGGGEENLLSDQDRKLPGASSIKEYVSEVCVLFSKARSLLSRRKSNIDKSRKANSQWQISMPPCHHRFPCHLATTDFHATLPPQISMPPCHYSFSTNCSGWSQSHKRNFRKVVRQCTSKTCNVDPCPPDLLKKPLHSHIPFLAVVVNDSFQQGLFPKALKTALVRSLLKKEGLDASILANHPPVSNIPFISKVLEKVAVYRLLKHLTLSNLYEEYQSANRTLHSTETALL